MSTLRKNVAGQFFFFQGVKTADGTAFTDTVTGTVAKDGAADAALAGTITHLANGKYRVAPTQADTNADFLGFGFTGTGMIPVTANYITTGGDPSDGVRGGLTALPNVAAGAAGGLPTDTDANGAVRIVDGTGARELDTTSGVVSANVTFWQGVPQTVDTSGKASVDVGAWAGATGAVKLDPVQSLPEVTSALIGAMGIQANSFVNNSITNAAIAAGAITSSEAPNLDVAVSTRSNHSAADVWFVGVREITGGTVSTVNDKTGYSLTVAERDAIAAARGAYLVEAGVTVDQSLQLANAANAGKLAGAGTGTITIQDRAGTKNRITATVDGSGNRTAVAVSLD